MTHSNLVHHSYRTLDDYHGNYQCLPSPVKMQSSNGEVATYYVVPDTSSPGYNTLTKRPNQYCSSHPNYVTSNQAYADNGCHECQTKFSQKS